MNPNDLTYTRRFTSADGEKMQARITELEKEREKLQALKNLIDLKFKSGNSVEVDRITITRAEYESIANAGAV